MKKQIYLIVFQLFLTGCATNYYVNEDHYTAPKNYEKISVYVTNPEHEAYEVLKKSQIYDLSENPNGPNKLTLIGFSHYGKCGTGGFIVTAATFGVLPSGGDIIGQLAYAMESGQTTRLYRHKILYSDSFSLWSVPLRPLAYTKKGAQAKALSLSTRDICKDYTSCQYVDPYEY